jgi:hypothetical protein
LASSIINSCRPSCDWTTPSNAAFRLVQTEPNDPTLSARKNADFLDRHIADPLAVAVERAGNDPRSRSIGGDGEVEHISRIFSAGFRARGFRAARCHDLRDSGWS